VVGTPVEVAMRASWTWAWASVLVLCLAPVAAQGRERDRERGRERDHGRPRAEGHSDRGERHSDRGARHSDRSERPAREWSRQDSGRGRARTEGSQDRSSGWRPGQDDRSGRGSGSRDSWGGSGRDRRDDGRWRGSYRSAPRRGFSSFGYRPRYPASYRYGYFHGHGYYFPRYYYDYDAYPTHASMRVLVQPAEAEVYVDGYYAGIVDDFDGLFQRLHLTPGRHEITLRLDGFRTWRAEVYAEPGHTLTLHHDMLPGATGPDFGDDRGPDEEPGADQAPDAGYQP
jgi:hypothetical protein